MPFELVGFILTLPWTMGTAAGRIIFPCGRPSGRIAPTRRARTDREARVSVDFQRRRGVDAITE